MLVLYSSLTQVLESFMLCGYDTKACEDNTRWDSRWEPHLPLLGPVAADSSGEPLRDCPGVMCPLM